MLFTQDARAGVIAARDWYEERAPDLGARFRAELDLAVQRIAGNPLQFPLEIHDVRRALMRRFPYSLLFRVESDAITVIACFHASRDSEQCQRRTGS